jgi:hypothetical protein
VRGQVVTQNSKFRGLLCQTCTQPIRPGQSAMTHTLYIADEEARPQRSTKMSECVVRIAWHTKCLRRILDNAPLDQNLVERMVEEHKKKIRERMSS